MRRVLVALVWLAAIAAVVVAIGTRVRAKRLADPVQVLSAYLSDLPPDLGRVATIVSRDRGSLQLELRADQRWLTTFAERNRFAPVDGALSGLAADRWVLTEGKRKDAIVHLLIPLDGQPALLTIVE